jgi:hypothetical protein
MEGVQEMDANFRVDVSEVIVNWPDGEHTYTGFKPGRSPAAVLDDINHHHPSWTSLVITVVKVAHE